MFFEKVVKCAVVALFLLHQCHSQTDDDQRHFDGLKVNASLISEENVTRRVIGASEDNFKSNDKSQNRREFPSSAKHRRSVDKNDRFVDYPDDGIFPALLSDEDQQSVECILERSEFYLSWWVHENGTLKMPESNRTGKFSAGFADLSIYFGSEATIFRKVSDMTSDNASDVIIFMSLANNQLERLPNETLNLVSFSLQYLSLANNDFSQKFYNHNTSFQKWSNFPLMQSLRELDLRNCSITHLDEDVFDNLPNLEKLFLSHNFINEITSRTISTLTRLSHFDLSYNNKRAMVPFTDQFSIDYDGVLFEENFFEKLPNLIFLDLSHSTLKQDSVKALAHLHNKVEQLSLCYTKITVIVANMFSNTNLKVLDLSGNPTLTPTLSSNWFWGLEEKLEILIFRDSNLKNIGALRSLRKLKMLDLDNNNINQIHPSTFSSFSHLEILDLNMNHISNWHDSVLSQNEQLAILNLRRNNINLITSQMMTDFNRIKYLAIGANSFVCNCALREFIDRASLNAQVRSCSVRPRRSKRSTATNLFDEFYNPKFHYEVFWRQFHSYVKYADESCKNIIGVEQASFILRSSSRAKDNEPVVSCEELYLQQQNPETTMSFNFLLLDYSENDYHCIDSDEIGNRKFLFSELEPCMDKNFRSTEPSSSLISTGAEGITDDGYGEVVNVQLPREPNKMLIIYISVGVPLTLIISLWFWYRRELRYFWSIFKNTIILSFEKEDKKALMMTNRRRKSHASDNFTYDVFVSYCDKDREWVLDHLIPNIERRSEVTICLHERDFQVGLSILENIIQCMDQSRCLLLVISESFLKSNWCSFEMHLAQHRLIETRREQLILVLLQDIPKSKRPRTLNFLMRTKTYIMWPSDDTEEQRNIFWKRLKKAIIPNNWDPERTKAKPRHSVV